MSVAPVVIKIGGALLADAETMASVWRGALKLGEPFVLVHGGGPQATALARRLGHEPTIVAGRRVTSDLDLDIALWTLRGELNARLVASGLALGIRAVGVSALDGAMVHAHRRPPRELVADGETEPQTVDFGHVGDISGADPELLRTLLDARWTPVVAPVCVDANGALLNVNADTVAMELAVALSSPRLDLVTEAAGVRRDAADPISRILQMTAAEASAGVDSGWIAGGMRPKLEVAIGALERGVPRVRICDPIGISDSQSGTTIVL